jgi:SAM-dependent methyltransferase
MAPSPFEAALLSPTVARNRDPILAVLRRVLPASGVVLEIASGTGEHAVHFAAGLPHLTWQPTDIDAAALRSIEARRAAAGLTNLLPVREFDVTAAPWPALRADAVVCINMIHIAPWRAAERLVTGAAHLLSPGCVLFLYGPFKENGAHTAPSNAAFDASLRANDPQWGVRDLGDVAALAGQHGFDLVERVAMPANNLSVVFRRGTRPASSTETP